MFQQNTAFVLLLMLSCVSLCHGNSIKANPLHQVLHLDAQQTRIPRDLPLQETLPQKLLKNQPTPTNGYSSDENLEKTKANTELLEDTAELTDIEYFEEANYTEDITDTEDTEDRETIDSDSGDSSHIDVVIPKTTVPALRGPDFVKFFILTLNILIFLLQLLNCTRTRSSFFE